MFFQGPVTSDILTGVHFTTRSSVYPELESSQPNVGSEMKGVVGGDVVGAVGVASAADRCRSLAAATRESRGRKDSCWTRKSLV